MFFNARKKIFKNKVFFIFLGLFILCFCYFYWLYAKPYTQNAFVVANIRPVTAFVPGYVTKVYVENNSFIKKGEKLFDIYKMPYELQVTKLENQLAATEHKAEALSHLITIAQYSLDSAKFSYDNAKYLSTQATFLAVRNAVAQKEAEEKLRTLQEVFQNLDIAKQQLAVAQQNYYETLNKIKVTQSELELARINLKWTTVYAQSDGYVTNMFLSPGTYVTPGVVLFAFIDTTNWWVQANFEETELSQIKEGQKAIIKLWQYPGTVFEGVVTATGWGVQRNASNASGMPIVKKENQWFLLPQRYPVMIKILNTNSKNQLHPGGSAWVRIEAPAYPIRELFRQFFGI